MNTNSKKNNEWEHILLLGCDSQISGEYERSDGIIIASFNYRKSLVKLTSVMRDIWVDIPGHGEGKINAAVVYGGAKLTVKLIGETFGLNIRHYAMINMKGLVKVFDALGGVDISVDDKELDFINENTIDVQRIILDESEIEPLKASGNVHLCGAQVMAYMRDRRHGYEYARTARQRKVLGIAIKKLKTDKSLKRLLRLAFCVIRRVRFNIPVHKLFKLFGLIKKADTDSINSLRLPAEGTYEAIYDTTWKIKADFKKNRQVLKDFLGSDGSEQPTPKTNTLGENAFTEINPDYKKWKQTDSAINKKEAWPASLFPDAVHRYFSDSGSLVIALAILLRSYGIENETNPLNFNPWVLNERLIKCGAFDATASLFMRDIDLIYDLEYAGVVPYSREKLVEVYNSGEPFLITVPGTNVPKHFIVPDYLTDDDMAVIDPASEKRFLSEFESVLNLRLFRRCKKNKLNPVVALTFDDGPAYCGETEIILDTLEKYNAKATFFTVGNRLLKKPESLKRKLKMGCEIGSHTWNHEHYGKDVTKEDILKCNEKIKELTGQYPTCFRSPGGKINPFIRQVCREAGLPIFYWSVDTEDWKFRDAEKLCETALKKVRDGDIILMHEIYESTARGLDAVLKALTEQGFGFVTCSELVMQKTGKAPEPGIRYWKNGLICNDTK